MPVNHVSVVLVHGAWADGSSWSKVIGPLKAAGMRVVAAPLPLTSLTDDVAAVELKPGSHGLVWLPEAAFAEAFAQNASPGEQAILAAVQRPINVASIGVPVERPRWKDGPSWVLVAEDDRMINPKTQLFQAERMGAHVRTRPVDHTPLVTAPAEVIGIILDAVGDVAATT